MRRAKPTGTGDRPNVRDDVNGDGQINTLDKKATRSSTCGTSMPWTVSELWGMAIDLTSCIGCGACDRLPHRNNVPVVGKDEVLRHRDMPDARPLLRVRLGQRARCGGGLGVVSTYEPEEPGANPQAVHMPMMCSTATTHRERCVRWQPASNDVNQMTYNRCIGTLLREQLPIQVRRFNWFHYPGYNKFQNVNPAQDAIQR